MLPLKRKQVGEYVLTELLGEGERSTVRLAQHVPTQEKVAVKIYEKSPGDDPKQWQAMRAEVKRLSRLHHSNLVELLEAMESEHGYYLVFEHAPGGSVDQLPPSRLNMDLIRRLFLQLLDALGYLHSHGFMFGHLKLSSCLLDHTLSVKIKGLHRCTSLDTGGDYPVSVVGQIKRAVDVWSLGAILLRLVTHRLQPASASDNRQQKNLTGTDFFVPASVPKDLEDVLRRMLDSNPVTRITLADLHRHPWCQPSLPPPSLLPARPLAPDLVREVAQRHSVPEEEVRRSVLSHRADNLAATYLLLRRRVLSGRGLPPPSTAPTTDLPTAAPSPSAPPPPASIPASPAETEPAVPDFRTCLTRLREKARQQRVLARPGPPPSSLGAVSEQSIVLSRLNSGLLEEGGTPGLGRETTGAITLPSAFTSPSSPLPGAEGRRHTSCALCRSQNGGRESAQVTQRQRRAALRLASNPSEVYTSLSRRFGSRFVKDESKVRAVELYTRQLGLLMAGEPGPKEDAPGKRQESVAAAVRTPPPPPNSRLQTRASRRSSANSGLERAATQPGPPPSSRDPAKSAFGSQLKSTRPRREYTSLSTARTFQWSHHQAVNVI